MRRYRCEYGWRRVNDIARQSIGRYLPFTSCSVLLQSCALFQGYLTVCTYDKRVLSLKRVIVYERGGGNFEIRLKKRVFDGVVSFL